MTATYAVLVCLSSTDATTVIRLEAQARIHTCLLHTCRSPKGRPASWSWEAASTTLLIALRGHMPRLHDMPVALRLKPKLSKEAALCQCLQRLCPRGRRQFFIPVLRPAVPCINSCRQLNDAGHADGTGALDASTSCMVVMVRLIAAGSQDTSHIVPARPYLALLECKMRGDAAAGLRAIAALA